MGWKKEWIIHCAKCGYSLADTWNFPEDCPNCGEPMQRIERLIEINENAQRRNILRSHRPQCLNCRQFLDPADAMLRPVCSRCMKTLHRMAVNRKEVKK